MNAIVSSVVRLDTPRVSEATISLNRAIGAAWRAYIQEHHATAAQHAVYALLRGKSLDKTFTPLRRPSKIQAHGGVADRARQAAEWSARQCHVEAFSPFAGLLKGVEIKAGSYQAPSENPLLSRVLS